MAPEKHYLQNGSGTTICVQLLRHQCVSTAGSLVLGHGTFSNSRTYLGLARHLHSVGFEVWMMESQGHGLSSRPVNSPDFEQMFIEDSEAVLAYVTSRSHRPLYWVGHSGGALAVLMLLARKPELQGGLNGVVNVAGQATDAGIGRIRQVVWSAAIAATRILGYVPGRLMRLGPEDESAAVMLQWLGWSLAGKWTGRDGFDYLASLAHIHLPMLTIAAGGDRWIAPPSGCLKIHHAVSSDTKDFVLASTDTGYKEDYSHARIISSRAASVEIWPRIGRWLLKQSDISQAQ